MSLAIVPEGMTAQPVFGIRPRRPGTLRVLALERIRAADPHMVYAMLTWWQRLGRCDVNVVNLDPVDVFAPIPPEIDFRDFDAVVLCPRLCYDPIALLNLDRVSPCRLADYSGLKVLMRQDENYITDAITDFVAAAGIDLYYTCVPPDQCRAAFGDMVDRCQIRTILTGYVDPAMAAQPAPVFSGRPLDLAYRAYLGHLSGGRLIYEKYAIGAFARETLGPPLVLDVSMDPSDRIYGDDWLRHLAGTKAVLGVQSGSNVFDRDGSLARTMAAINESTLGPTPRLADLNAFYATEVEPRLRGHDGAVRYGQISPRHFEAAMMGAVQIMPPANLGSFLEPGVHYIQVRPDFADLAEAVERVRDPNEWARFALAAHDRVTTDPGLRIETLIAGMESDIESLVRAPLLPPAGTESSPANGPAWGTDAAVLEGLVETLGRAHRLYGPGGVRAKTLTAKALRRAEESGGASLLTLTGAIVGGWRAAGKHVAAPMRGLLLHHLGAAVTSGTDPEWIALINALLPVDEAPDPYEDSRGWRLLNLLADADRSSLAADLYHALMNRHQRHEATDAITMAKYLERVLARTWRAGPTGLNTLLAREIVERAAAGAECGFTETTLARARRLADAARTR